VAEVIAELILDMSTALSQVAELGAAVDEATQPVTLEVEADVSPAEAEIDSVEATPVEVPVEADVAPAEGEIAGLEAEPVEVSVEANTESAEAALSDLTGATEGVAEGASTGALELAGLNAAAGNASVAGLAGAAGIGALGAAAVTAVSSFGDAQQVVDSTNILIENTGNNANTSAEEIAAYASRTQDLGVASDEAAQAGANQLLAMQEVRNEAGTGNDIFDRTLELSRDYAAITGGDVTSATQRFGRALNDPVRGMNLLRRSGVLFTEAQREQVEALVESGDTLGAQRVLLDALEGRYRGAAEELSGNVNPSLAEAAEKLDELAEAAGEVAAPAVLSLTSDLTALFETGAAATSWAQDVSDAIGDIDVIPGGGILTAFVEAISPVDRLRSVLRDVDDAADDAGSTLTSEFTTGGQAVFEAQLAITETVNAILAAQAATDEGARNAAGSLGAEAEAVSELNAEVSALAENLDAVQGPQQGVEEGAIAVRDAQREALQAFADADGVYQRQTEGGDALLTSLQQVGAAMQDQTLNLLANGASAEEASAAQDIMIASLRRQALASGLSREETENLIDTYLRVPETEITAFSTPGSRESIDQARKVKEAVDAIPKTKSVLIQVTSTIDQVNADIDRLLARADQIPDLNLGESAAIPVAVTSGGAGNVQIIDQTSVTVDARGAQDPQGVAEAVEAVLAPRRAKLAVTLSQRGA
jgi:tail length tape measure protein